MSHKNPVDLALVCCVFHGFSMANGGKQKESAKIQVMRNTQALKKQMPLSLTCVAPSHFSVKSLPIEGSSQHLLLGSLGFLAGLQTVLVFISCVGVYKLCWCL